LSIAAIGCVLSLGWGISQALRVRTLVADLGFKDRDRIYWGFGEISKIMSG